VAGNKVAVGATVASTDLIWNRYQMAFLQAMDARTSSGRRRFNRFALFAGRRGGKTRIGAIAAVREMKPGTLGWACAPSYPELQDYVLPALLSIIPKDWIADWSQSRLELTLVNGARCAFRSLDDPNRGRGPGLDWCWIDEARKVQELAWDVIAPAVFGNLGAAWITTTPNGFDWCWRRFWVPADEGEPGMWATRYWTVENPKFQTREAAEELAAERRRMDPVFFAQEYQADFVTFTGAIYGKSLEPQILNGDVAVKQIIPEWPNISPERPCYVGIDPGADHPFAAVVIVATEKGLVQVGEYIARNKSVYEHKRALLQLLAKWNPTRPFWPERWAIDRSQRQMAIELAQAPFAINATAAENDVRAGINRVLSWLQTGQLWLVADECKRTIEQLRGYRWDENIAPDGTYRKEAPMKVSDDLPDALRYLLMLYPELPEASIQGLNPERYDLFTDEQKWSVARTLDIGRREMARARGEEEDDGESGLAGVGGLFQESRRKYYEDEDSDPLGVGDLWG
jgi:hypothetical protein